jgi:hypothetical protein
MRMSYARAVGALVLVLVTITNGVGVAVADEVTPITPIVARELTPKEIGANFAPMSADIRRCYLDVAGETRVAGKLDVKVVVHRNGLVHSIDVAITGPSAKLKTRIDACVRALVEPLEFPARKGFTTAKVPFVFQRTTAPNSGPQHSCWSAKGCGKKSGPALDATPGVPLAKR